MKLASLNHLVLVLCLSTLTFAVLFPLRPEEELAPPQAIAEALTATIMSKREAPESQYNPTIPLSEELQEALYSACEEFGVDLPLALGLIEKESNFREDIVSATGCYGLCQLNRKYFPVGLSPTENIRYGVEYLAFQLERYGDVKAALTAYNAGHDTGKRGYANAVLANASEWEKKLLWES